MTGAKKSHLGGGEGEGKGRLEKWVSFRLFWFFFLHCRAAAAFLSRHGKGSITPPLQQRQQVAQWMGLPFQSKAGCDFFPFGSWHREKLISAGFARNVVRYVRYMLMGERNCVVSFHYL